MDQILGAITALISTPIPTILVVSGVLFLLLSVVSVQRIMGELSIPPPRQKYAAVIGLLLTTLGVGLHATGGMLLTESGSPGGGEKPPEQPTITDGGPTNPNETADNSAYPDAKAVSTYDDFGTSENNGAFDKRKWILSDEHEGSNGDILQGDGRLTLSRKELPGPNAKGGFDLTAREYNEIKVHDDTFFEARLKVDRPQDGNIFIAISSTASTDPYSDCSLGYGEDKAEIMCSYYNNSDDDKAEYDSRSLSVEYGTWHTVRIVIKPAKSEFVYYADTDNIGSHKPRNKEVFEGKFTFQIGIWSDSSKPVVGYIDEVKVGPWAKLSKSLSVVLEHQAAGWPPPARFR